jgi:AcrR family transcriptional regulator
MAVARSSSPKAARKQQSAKKVPLLPPDPVTPRGWRTRSTLIAAARVIFERDGFLNARIVDITDQAGLGIGSFYKYFGTKESLFAAVVEDLQAEMLKPDEGGPSDSLWSDIEAANRRYLEVYKENSRLMLSWEDGARVRPEFAQLISVGRESYLRRTASTLRRLQKAGAADPELDPDYAALALTEMVRNFAYSWFNADLPFDLDRAVDQVTRLWFNAVTAGRS